MYRKRGKKKKEKEEKKNLPVFFPYGSTKWNIHWTEGLKKKEKKKEEAKGKGKKKKAGHLLNSQPYLILGYWLYNPGFLSGFYPAFPWDLVLLFILLTFTNCMNGWNLQRSVNSTGRSSVF